jgi:hypothetical protein
VAAAGLHVGEKKGVLPLHAVDEARRNGGMQWQQCTIIAPVETKGTPYAVTLTRSPDVAASISTPLDPTVFAVEHTMLTATHHDAPFISVATWLVVNFSHSG